ncbi:phosphonate ABC transporter ATP-binding protein [Hydrogenophaga sp. PBL-H3]|uniref:phosphonate ABC transporter ATP-binding protein n=1 Tax=Hydrogenophaga sp. PBL-H3 TaxID=434010 RepID=UPI00131FF4B7|nr:ATP-binding cassette domain-containing protein [Hydrogenophaga sp. PBL-H3]QHE75434.1 ATP-binding cassette domain-containing protein [Hydrogenophaga sp. PBL-H3]QHE79861.1 ATP-binding cassette domain-containing protein [Hydrogenophaga sp. PBL-H3]
MNITLQGVSARHPAARVGHAPALRALDLQIASGEQVAVIGPSGAGKTTLLQVMACALPPTEGQFTLDGHNPWALPRAALQRQRGQLFLAPQVPPLPPRQRVVTSVLAARLPAMGLLSSLRSLYYPSDIPAAFEALDHFDLADKLFERVDRLSGGERQRVGLARALLAPARLWLIDEPLSALDPTRSKQAVAALQDGARERGVTLVATLHQVDVALAHFPRIVGLRDGQLAFDLPAAEVTQERLARLYDQFEHELRGEVPVVPAVEPTAPQPAVMHCR